VVPCLAFTLMAGPAGLVLYWIVKLAYRSARRSQVGSA
jgi:membrane protein insertase Oxa1/YidC/SpoIIIJ